MEVSGRAHVGRGTAAPQRAQWEQDRAWAGMLRGGMKDAATHVGGDTRTRAVSGALDPGPRHWAEAGAAFSCTTTWKPN